MALALNDRLKIHEITFANEYETIQTKSMRSKTITDKSLIPIEMIERQIYFIRGEKVMLDSDLAALYGVPTKSLNLAVRRNKDRFPSDFMFQLNQTEERALRFQFETSRQSTPSMSHGGRRYSPHAFTEQGIAMLSSVLKSKQAIIINIAIMRTFVRVRQFLSTHKALAAEIEAMKREYNKKFTTVFRLINHFIMPPEQPQRPMGFDIPKRKAIKKVRKKNR